MPCTLRSHSTCLLDIWLPLLHCHQLHIYLWCIFSKIYGPGIPSHIAPYVPLMSSILPLQKSSYRCLLGPWTGINLLVPDDLHLWSGVQHHQSSGFAVIVMCFCKESKNQICCDIVTWSKVLFLCHFHSFGYY